MRSVEAGYLPKVKVLQGLSLHVDSAEIVCLIGPNGAGKSTVLRTISGLLTPSGGQVVFEGEILNGLRPDLILRRGIAHVPQGHSAFPEMSARENLLMGAYTVRDRSERRRRMQRVFEIFPSLSERPAEKAGNFSGGQQKMLEIGRALMMQPRIILLDEPSLGLAPKMARLVFETVRQLRQAGITVLM
ncbi:MAG: ABC transporter ATP-binding protein, partial [Anaerolineales bacterium]